jgi:hypothetical protein
LPPLVAGLAVVTLTVVVRAAGGSGWVSVWGEQLVLKDKITRAERIIGFNPMAIVLVESRFSVDGRLFFVPSFYRYHFTERVLHGETEIE